MSKISAVFSDVGGVMLTNGWDHAERARFVQKYDLNAEEYECRHHAVALPFDSGRMNLDQYLDHTLFYCDRPFSRQDAADFMFAQSEALPGSLNVFARLAQSKTAFMATLNNESRELNLHRIEKFGLRQHFFAFFSSCYFGVSKPDPQIYKVALDISQRRPEESLFIDDRPENLEVPRSLGLQTIQFRSAEQLESDLRSLGLEF